MGRGLARGPCTSANSGTNFLAGRQRRMRDCQAPARPAAPGLPRQLAATSISCLLCSVGEGVTQTMTVHLPGSFCPVNQTLPPHLEVMAVTHDSQSHRPTQCYRISSTVFPVACRSPTKGRRSCHRSSQCLSQQAKGHSLLLLTFVVTHEVTHQVTTISTYTNCFQIHTRETLEGISYKGTWILH